MNNKIIHRYAQSLVRSSPATSLAAWFFAARLKEKKKIQLGHSLPLRLFSTTILTAVLVSRPRQKTPSKYRFLQATSGMPVRKGMSRCPEFAPARACLRGVGDATPGITVMRPNERWGYVFPLRSNCKPSAMCSVPHDF